MAHAGEGSLEVGEGIHERVVNPNEFHDDEIEAGSPVGTSLGPAGENAGECDEAALQWADHRVKPVKYAGCARGVKETHRLGRLTERRNNDGDVSSAPARDDLTGMKFEAGLVKEARGKKKKR